MTGILSEKLVLNCNYLFKRFFTILQFQTFSFKDNEVPAITCPFNQTVNTEPSLPFATVVWADPEAADNSYQHPTSTCNVESGSQFDIGKTNVTCKAQDASGNEATCSFTVDVQGDKFVHSMFM